jgi:hypothetical protein
MAAPRPGFDPSLNPGGAAIESNHTVKTKVAEAALKKSGALSQEPYDPFNLPPEPSAKEEAAKEAEKPLVKKTPPGEVEAHEDANKKEKAALDLEKKHAGEAGSKAATWAGPGAPPALTAGDNSTIAAPRPGFDPSLNPGGKNIESDHTMNTKAKEASLKKKTLVQKNAPENGGLPEAP